MRIVDRMVLVPNVNEHACCYNAGAKRDCCHRHEVPLADVENEVWLKIGKTARRNVFASLHA